MEYKTVELVKEGTTATLYLNRVNSLNAMDVQMIKELTETLKQVASSDINLLFITGRGRAFSAGGDLKTMLSNTDEKSFKTVMDIVKEMIVTLYRLPAITVSLINGPAAGIGLSFALGSDFVLANNKAKVAMNFINIGLVPDGGGHYFLKHRLGETKAKQLIWDGKLMTVDEALRIGIIDEVYEISTEEQLELVKRRMVTRPLKAMIASKLIYSAQELTNLINILDLETKQQLELRRTEDHREGVAAFLEKRVPHFSGR